MKKYLLFTRVVPRWLIMLVDLVIVTWSFSTSYFIVQRFEFINILRGYFFIFTGLYAVIAALVMYIMRIHIGLIRYSNTRDVLRIFSATFLTSMLYLLLINAWVAHVIHVDLVTINLVLLINFSVSSTLLILLRTTVKSIFFYLNNNTTAKRTVVLIYGSDNNAVFVKQALEASANTNFSVVGFVDGGSKKIDKEIQQVRVYHIDKLAKLKEKHNVDKLIIMNHHFDEKAKKIALGTMPYFGYPGTHRSTFRPMDIWQA